MAQYYQHEHSKAADAFVSYVTTISGAQEYLSAQWASDFHEGMFARFKIIRKASGVNDDETTAKYVWYNKTEAYLNERVSLSNQALITARSKMNLGLIREATHPFPVFPAFTGLSSGVLEYLEIVFDYILEEERVLSKIRVASMSDTSKMQKYYGTPSLRHLGKIRESMKVQAVSNVINSLPPVSPLAELFLSHMTL